MPNFVSLFQMKSDLAKQLSKYQQKSENLTSGFKYKINHLIN